MIMTLKIIGAQQIFCPTLSKKESVFDKLPPKGRCPNGKELMQDAVIPMTFAGGGPYIVRKDKELVGGCLAAIIDLLGNKFGFLSTRKPAKNFKKLVESVSPARTGSLK